MQLISHDGSNIEMVSLFVSNNVYCVCNAYTRDQTFRNNTRNDKRQADTHLTVCNTDVCGLSDILLFKFRRHFFRASVADYTENIQTIFLQFTFSRSP